MAKRGRRSNPNAKRRQMTRQGRKTGSDPVDKGSTLLRQRKLALTGREDLPLDPAALLFGRDLIDRQQFDQIPQAPRIGHMRPVRGGSMYSLAQAAKAAGKSKPTIARAIASGKISAVRRDDGSYEIDPAELHRVFPLVGCIAGTMKQSVPGNGAGSMSGTSPGEIEGLHQRIAEQAETIRRLWEQVEAESAERRQLSERLTALLTHRRSGSVPAVPQSAPRPRGWRRWFR